MFSDCLGDLLLFDTLVAFGEFGDWFFLIGCSLLFRFRISFLQYEVLLLNFDRDTDTLYPYNLKPFNLEIALSTALPLSFFICLSFFSLLNASPDVTKICEKVKHKDLCISSFNESYLGRYIPDNADVKALASVIFKITVNSASDVSRNLKTMVLEGPVPLTPEVRAKYGICDSEVVSAMKELDKVRTADTAVVVPFKINIP
ncbi:hypothetical protein V6N13_027204 [Hibiscus sabdariffa]